MPPDVTIYRNDSDFQAAMGGMTYKDLHGREITFCGPNGAQPYKRALAFHVGCLVGFLAALKCVGARLLFTIVFNTFVQCLENGFAICYYEVMKSGPDPLPHIAPSTTHSIRSTGHSGIGGQQEEVSTWL